MVILRILLASCLLIASVVRVCAAPPQGVVASIDAELSRSWKRDNIQPAETADDATFLRRLTLDLVGRIPTANEYRSFWDDRSPDRRERLRERLLSSPGFARHWASILRQQMLPQASTPEFASLGPGFESWLYDQLRAQTSYDQICREILLAKSDGEWGYEIAGLFVESPPQSFLVASRAKPELMAANTARAFLGLNLDCAQCHNHPFARWTQDQFWDFAAFFATGNQLPIPDKQKVARARLFTNETLKWSPTESSDKACEALAHWATDSKNQYFARNAINRVWAQLLGRGLVEPLDDMSDSNPSHQPEVLKELERTFVESGFSLRHLIRVVTSTQAYQLANSSKSAAASPHFEHTMIRGLSGAQLYDSLQMAAGLPLALDDELVRYRGRRSKRSPRRQFIDQFYSERAATAQRSILQALELMNGDVTSIAERGKTVSGTADSPHLDAAGRVEAIYVAVLSRSPTQDELSDWVPHVGTQDLAARRRGLADLFWVLVNSTEFSVNH